MKNLILAIMLPLCLVACQSDLAQKDEENLKLVTSYVEAVEKMDFDAMGNFLDEKYMGLGPSYGDTIYKAQAVENWKNNVATLYEKIKYNRSKMAPVTIADGPNKGEWVVNWSELHITYKDSIGDVTIWANTSYLVENGKIIRSITMYNEADALRQLGYKIVPADE